MGYFQLIRSFNSNIRTKFGQKQNFHKIADSCRNTDFCPWRYQIARI